MHVIKAAAMPKVENVKRREKKQNRIRRGNALPYPRNSESGSLMSKEGKSGIPSKEEASHPHSSGIAGWQRQVFEAGVLAFSQDSRQ